MFDVGSALDVVKHARATITDAKSVINDAARRATDRKMSSQTIGPLADSILTLPGVILFGWLCTERHWKTDGGGVNAIESSARKICQVALSQIRGCLDDGEHREPGIKWREVKTFYFHGNPRLSFRDRAPTLISSRMFRYNGHLSVLARMVVHSITLPETRAGPRFTLLQGDVVRSLSASPGTFFSAAHRQFRTGLQPSRCTRALQNITNAPKTVPVMCAKQTTATSTPSFAGH